MKYTKPEVEIMELDRIDVIQTSGDIDSGENSTPPTGFTLRDKETSGNVPTL